MAIYLLGLSPFSVAWSAWTYNTLALPLTGAWFMHSVWLDVQEPETVICVYLVAHASRASHDAWKHQHFSGCIGNSALSGSVIPQQEKRTPLQLASSSSFSLFPGAVYVVSNFRCCKPPCVTPLCPFWPWLHQSGCTYLFFPPMKRKSVMRMTLVLSIKRLTYTIWLLFIIGSYTDYICCTENESCSSQWAK